MAVVQSSLVLHWLLLSTWLPAAQPSCTKGRPAECKDAPMAPGTNLAGEGFDVVTMERKQAYVIDVDTWRDNGSCTLCVNPFMQGKPQKLPAVVVDWRPSHKCDMMLTSKVYESSESFVKDSQTGMDASWKVGLDLPTTTAKYSMTVGGTHSRAAKNVMDKSKQDKYSFIKQEVHCSYYSYRLKEDLLLHSEFSRALGHLPALYTDQSKADYTRFLHTFGTHFIRKVTLGGQVKSLTSVRVCQAALDGYTDTEVKDCLEVEASASSHTGTAAIRAETKFCKNDLKKRSSKTSFSSTFKDRFTQVVGGQTDGTPDILFSQKSNPGAFGKWMESLKSTPDIIQYSLHPLHLLVKQATRRKSLKKSVEDYIMEHALIQRCSEKCPSGSCSSSRDKCQCVCQPNKEVTTQCCPQEQGLAHLTVTVQNAKDLYGDTQSQTDGFVKILMGTKARQTKVIYNNDNPQWNEKFYLGTVTLSLSSKLKMEVWDEDKHWYKSWNDLLGFCSIAVTQGSNTEVCLLNHGNLYFSYKLECAPGLGGPTCSEYVPSAMNPDLRDLYTSRHNLNVTQDLLAQLRMGRDVNDPLTFVVKQRADHEKVKVPPRLRVLNEL